MGIDALLEEIMNRLNTWMTDRELIAATEDDVAVNVDDVWVARLMPENETELFEYHEKGVVNVDYGGSSFGKASPTDYVQQEETVTVVLFVEVLCWGCGAASFETVLISCLVPEHTPAQGNARVSACT